MIAIPNTYVRKYVRNFSKIATLMIDLPKGKLKTYLDLVIVMQLNFTTLKKVVTKIVVFMIVDSLKSGSFCAQILVMWL